MDSSFNPSISPQPVSAASRTRPLAETPAQAAAAVSLLRTPNALAEMSDDDARCVVSYMRLAHFATGATVFREGDQGNTSYLLLILSGDVEVHTADIGGQELVPISVLGAGHIIGEMGLIDGAPRSTTCQAASAIEAAGLSRKALELMIEEHPRVAARLLVALTKRLADRLRAMNGQLQLYAQLSGTMQAEITRLKAHTLR
jgi:CRP/FNR family transcriptional regulator, cyclic AMP receptor protein